jgi:hypothetical protein
MAERDITTVGGEYARGLRLAQRGSYFEAHEAFENAWRACAAGERDFFQGLVHVVVSAYQHGRGRQLAEERQRAKALRRLAPYAPGHRGLDVTALLAALERAEPDVREQLVQSVAQPEVAVEEQQDPEGNENRP